jgi:hypothetical protein
MLCIHTNQISICHQRSCHPETDKLTQQSTRKWLRRREGETHMLENTIISSEETETE